MNRYITPLLAGLACLFVMAAGCTSISGTASTPTMTVVVTTVSTGLDPWSGTWDTISSTTIAYRTLGNLTMTATGSSVTGTFRNRDQGTGTISGTLSGNQLTGTWTVNYSRGSDNGQFLFVLSDDKKTFTGKWISASDTVDTLNTTEEFWDGTRR
ncbi:MAG: hypothetical protein WC342_09875 [Methanoregula sp.]|jgi:hypothetical protein